MADYSFLFDKQKEQAFVERCAAACLVLADAIVKDGAATADQKVWALKAFGSPLRVGKEASAIVIGANASATENIINNATDAQIQTAVDAAKDVLSA